MLLYYTPRTISVAVAITLEEAGLPYETAKLSFDTADHRAPEYLKINPKGRVPALVTDQGILTETGALLDYIADLAPNAKLVPSDPYQLAKMREAMYFLASTMHVNHAHRFRGARWADRPESWEDMQAKVPETMTASCQHVEEDILQGTYVLGETFSLADAYLFVVSTWVEADGVDLTPFPKVRQFQQAMEQRASVRAVRAAGMF